MTEKAPGREHESPKDPFDGLHCSKEEVSGYQKLSRSPVKLALFLRLLSNTRRVEGDPLGQAIAHDVKISLKKLATYVNSLSDEEASERSDQSDEELAGQAADAVSGTQDSDPKADSPKKKKKEAPKNDSTGNDGPKDDPKAKSERSSDRAQEESDPLDAFDLSDTGYDQLTREQKTYFIKKMTEVINSHKFTFDQLNNKDALRAAVQGAKQDIPSRGMANLHQPREVQWTPAEAPIADAQLVPSAVRPRFTPDQRLALALGGGLVGLGGLVGIAGIGLATHEVANDVRNALNPTPVVAPMQGPTSFTAPRVSIDFKPTDGGFGVAKSANGRDVVVRPSAHAITSILVNNEIQFGAKASLVRDAEGNISLPLDGEKLKNVQIFYTGADGNSKTDTVTF